MVERCTPDELADRVARRTAAGAHASSYPTGSASTCPGAVVDDGLTAAELDALDAVVTRAPLGIAETGTIVLDHGPGQGRRAITLVPDLHVCIVAADQVVADVPDAVAAARPRAPADLDQRTVSATSDIELDRVEGVHGPRHAARHRRRLSAAVRTEGGPPSPGRRARRSRATRWRPATVALRTAVTGPRLLIQKSWTIVPSRSTAWARTPALARTTWL